MDLQQLLWALKRIWNLNFCSWNVINFRSKWVHSRKSLLSWHNLLELWARSDGYHRVIEGIFLFLLCSIQAGWHWGSQYIKDSCSVFCLGTDSAIDYKQCWSADNILAFHNCWLLSKDRTLSFSRSSIIMQNLSKIYSDMERKVLWVKSFLFIPVLKFPIAVITLECLMGTSKKS